MLTKKQNELLIYIHQNLRETGVAPSYEEMKDALDLRSKSGIHRLIHALEVLSDVDDACLVRFSSNDVLRHTLFQKIIEAYERFKGK